MARGCWRIASGLLLAPVAVAGLTGCGNGASSGSASATGSAVKGTPAGGYTAAMLRGALLTRVNGVTAVEPAVSGEYSSLTASSGKQAAGGAQVTPKACAGAATGFDPTALGSAPAAAVSFRVGTNGVSEALIASSAGDAATAIAGQLPAQCGQIEETIGGKTYTYDIKEQAVSGIGEQARALDVQVAGAKSAALWSLIYRGKGFVGTVTVVGSNASQKAVTELGQQAYAFAAKTLS